MDEERTRAIGRRRVVDRNAAGWITFKQDVLLPLPDDMEASQPPVTPLRQGAFETIELFRRRFT